MNKLTDILDEAMGDAFERAGYDRTLGHVMVSDRPDLGEYQCNGALAAASPGGAGLSCGLSEGNGG